MRALLLLALVAPTLARAGEPSDPRAEADRLMLEGNQLGERGQLVDAIARFRAADRIYPRAKTACNIGLCLARLKAWPQAWLNLSRCKNQLGRDRPEWVDTRLAETAHRLRDGPYVSVEISPSPADAQVTASPFGDEPLPVPGVVWLPFGRHEIVATRAGHESVRRTLELETREARVLKLVLPESTGAPVDKPNVAVEKPTTGAGTGTVGTTPDSSTITPDFIVNTRPAPKRERLLLGTGIGLLGLGVAALGGGLGANLAGSSVRSLAANEPSGAQYERYVSQLGTDRAAAITLYTVGGVSVIAGTIVLAVRAHRRTQGR